MNGTRGYYAKWNKTIIIWSTTMWNLTNKAEDHRGRELKMKQDETGEGDKS